MSTTRPWTLDPACLSSALKLWNNTNPDLDTRARVHDWLMDCLSDALVGIGQEDPPGSGVFSDRVPETNVGVTYVPNVGDRTICIAAIFEAE